MAEPKDYSPWKVVDLKAELKRRGIIQTGLRVKQQLIDRLLQDDAESKEKPVAEDGTDNPPQEDNAPAEDKADATPTTTDATKEAEAKPESQQEEPKEEPAAEKSDESQGDLKGEEAAPTDDHALHQQEHKKEPSDKHEEEKAASEPADKESPPQTTTTDANEEEKPGQSPTDAEVTTSKEHEEKPEEGRQDTSPKDKEEHATTEPTASVDEKETNKRKRRESSTPPPEQVKKTKGENVSVVSREAETESHAQPGEEETPAVEDNKVSATQNEEAPAAEEATVKVAETKPESVQEVSKDETETKQEPMQDISRDDEAETKQGAVQEVSKDDKAETREEPMQDISKDDAQAGETSKPAPTIATDVADHHPEEPEKSTDQQTATERRSVPASARSPKKDNRFKELFPIRSTAENPPSPVREQDLQERPVSPAVHSATKALYITNLMRPLQPRALKAHLLSVAAPDADPDAETEVIKEFFLDSIKSHCFVIFDSTTAAARARIALHNAVWPADAMRKALWVDYVPEEKVKSWIDQEQDGSARPGPIRWEVVYQRDDEGAVVDTYLQELNPNGGTSARPPTGPASSLFNRAQPPMSPRVQDRSAGFQPLDERFLSTKAKPRLYYLPVIKEVSERRLDQFDDLRKVSPPPPGYGSGGGKRRYTFEDTDQFVDAGAEFGFGGGGGEPGRGGRGRRGGGFGGRDRGDHWSRNRGDGGWKGGGGGGRRW